MHWRQTLRNLILEHIPGPERLFQKRLRLDDSRLRELRTRYYRFDERVTVPFVWTPEYVQKLDLRRFRGDNGYLYQNRGANMSKAAYALTTQYLQSLDGSGLFGKCREDGAFGAQVYSCHGIQVSRDLLDSIGELFFLERHLRVSQWKGLKVLDVGAGYGRLAYRMTEALPEIGSYLCTDAVPESTYLCEIYLEYRKLSGKARVVPLDEFETELKKSAPDLAVNIHSFSECALEAIEWWVSRISKAEVRYWMIVPNPGAHGGKYLRTNAGQDFSGILDRYGYKQIACEPKYPDPEIQQKGIMPTWYYLFERSQVVKPAAR